MSDIVERLRQRPWRSAAENDYEAKERRQREREEGADEITALRAENERLKIENIQMQAALGYGILADDERHILPSNPFKCGTCDASKHLRAENERLRSALRGSYEVYAGSDGFVPATAAEGYQQQIIKQMVDCISAALEEKP